MNSHYDAATFVEILRRRAAEQSQQRAYTFLVDGKSEGPSLTYRELEVKAQAVGSWLQRHQAAGERALLLYPQGLELITAFLGCFLAGVIAVPVPPPESSRLKHTLPRLQAIAKDAQAKFVLTTSAILDLSQQHQEQFLEFESITWLDTEQLATDGSADWSYPNLTPDALAYLQYTSGSTSQPKGVMISHGNLAFHSAYLQRACGYTPNSVTVTWMPYFHDYGLVEGLLQPLFNGTPCFVMSPLSFIRRPLRWLQAIANYGGTHSQAPNFAYDLCVRRMSPEGCSGLDLSSWQAAGNAAEPINPRVLQRFFQTFEPFGFRWQTFCPAYGLAENTLLVSASAPAASPVLAQLDAAALQQDRIVEASDQSPLSQTVVGCGHLVCETQVAIVDPETQRRCAPDQVGEIWVSDPSVAQGYWHRAEETEQTFRAYTADTHEGPFLRTGDLGFMRDGELYISGRLKDLIIIRGTNHYPQDIEWTVQASHPSLRAEHGAAFSISVAGEEHLVVVQEVERQQQTLEFAPVIEAIQTAVANHHELELCGVQLLKPGSIPKTSSGKIQRRACRDSFLAGRSDAIATWLADKIKEAVPEAASGQPLASSFANGYGATANGQRPQAEAGNVASPTASSPVPPHPPAAPSDPPIAAAQQNSQSRDRAQELISWLRSYGQTRINSRLIDERRCIPPHIVLDLGNHGVLGMQIPESYGGTGLGSRDAMRVVEQLAAIDLTLATFVVNNDFLGIRPIQNHGTPALRDELLPQLAGGRELVAFALTEPAAGSNPQAIMATGAAQAGGGWRLQGTKVWSGSAGWAGIINVFVKLLDLQGKPQGITGFTLRQGIPGLRTGAESLTMGMRGMVQNFVHLDQAPVDGVHLLGQPGTGMVAAQDGMLYTRLAIGAMCVGGMKRCTQLMLRYASRRTIGTGRLLDNPVTLTRISQLIAATTAFDNLIARIADLLDHGGFVPAEAYIACKTAGPEFLWKATDTLVQLLGGRGYIETNMAAQMLRDARIFRTFEGPTETLTMFLGSRALHQNSELDRFLRDSLGAPAVADHLRAAVVRIQERWLTGKTPFADPPAALRWASMLVGDVTTYAILWAALQARLLDPTVGGQLRQAAAWVEQQFDQCLSAALSDRSAASIVLTAREASDLIANYVDTIGDIEQTCAGEDRQLDGFLRRQPDPVPQTLPSDLPGAVASEGAMAGASPPEPTAAVELQPGPPPPVVSAAAAADVPTEAISAWLVQWIARELKIAVATINPKKSFVHYGLDSVTAIMLVSDLEVYLGRELPPALVWTCPIIGDLAQHLAAEMQAAPADSVDEATRTQPLANGQAPDTTLPSATPGAAALPNIDGLSDQEVDALLTQLLAEEEMSHESAR